MQAGYVVNNEDRRGRQGRYVVGEPLPDDLVILPLLQPHNQEEDETAGQGDGCTVAAGSEGDPPLEGLDVTGLDVTSEPSTASAEVKATDIATEIDRLYRGGNNPHEIARALNAWDLKDPKGHAWTAAKVEPLLGVVG